MSTRPNDPLTREEVEKMRQLVLAHDRDNQPNNFDLSKPPSKPYVFEKFPMLVYNHEQSQPARDEMKFNRVSGAEEMVHVPAKLVSKTVHSDKELQAALKAGYQEKPPVFKSEDDEDNSAA